MIIISTRDGTCLRKEDGIFMIQISPRRSDLLTWKTQEFLEEEEAAEAFDKLTGFKLGEDYDFPLPEGFWKNGKQA